MDSKRIGRRIKAFRKLKGYTQVKLAKKLGLSLSLLGAIERGTRDISEEELTRIANFLQIDQSEITLDDRLTQSDG